MTATPPVNASGSERPLYQLRRVTKRRRSEDVEFHLTVSSLQLMPGEKIALVGESGCGKSTLLDLLAMVLQPDKWRTFRFHPGEEEADIGRIWSQRNQDALSDLRKKHIGYVLQTGGLLPFLSVEDNILLSRRLLHMEDDGTLETLGDKLGILDQLKKLPGLLSAGQRQRVAIARALAHKPSIVIADEPTASLDPVTAGAVMDHFVEMVDEFGATLICATHDWSQVERLGLRKLNHQARPLVRAKGSESVFSN